MRLPGKSRLRFLLAVGLILRGGLHQRTYAAEDHDRLQATNIAIVGFSSNVQSFPFYKCKWIETRAEAKSLADARAGKWYNAVSCTCRVICDNNLEMFENDAPPIQPPSADAKKSGGFVTTTGPFIRLGFLSKGDRQLLHTHDFGSLNLFDSRTPQSSCASPLGCFQMGARSEWRGPDALKANSERYEMSPGGLSEFEGRPVVAVQFRDMTSGETKGFSFDPALGYTPAYLWCNLPEFTKPNGQRMIPYVTQAYVTQVRACSKGRWFPERVLVVTSHHKADNSYIVKELKVVELDVDHRPDRKEFTLDVPAGTSVFNPLEPIKSFRLKQDEKVNVDDIDSIFEMCEKAPNDPLMETAIRHKQERKWLYWAAGALVLIILALFIRAFRRRSALPDPNLAAPQ